MFVTLKDTGFSTIGGSFEKDKPHTVEYRIG